MSGSSLAEALGDFMQIQGVYGVMLQQGPKVVLNRFPRVFSVNKLDQLASSIHEMEIGYQHVQRNVTQFLFAFNGGNLLIVGEDISSGTLNFKRGFLTFMLEDCKVIPFLITAARGFFSDFGKSVSSHLPRATGKIRLENEQWFQFQSGLAHLLGKVIGSAQSKKLIDRVKTSLQIAPTQGLPGTRFREFAMAVLLEIPNRSKQEALRREVEALLAQFSN